jgi:hypothetical protein
MASGPSIPRLGAGHAGRLTKRWSEPPRGVHLHFKWIKQFQPTPRSLSTTVAQLVLVR